jgi:L-seryl-tRNA(Ser) seleniumtransferase
MDRASNKRPILSNIPSVDELLRTNAARAIVDDTGHAHALDLARKVQAGMRQDIIGTSLADLSKGELVERACDQMLELLYQENAIRLRNVINCTGVVIHTNLGRAPLSIAARQAITDQAAAYCTLEYDLKTGRRGKRAPKCETLIAELTGAEDALVVNNCAAAAFFVLAVFGEGGEVVISRGELVEIGGDFRVPDVLVQSGASLREVGTTNRTKLADYAEAMNDKVRLILRVHPSNYRIIGFTSTPSLSELSGLARQRGVILYEDIGSGALIDLSDRGLTDEPVVSDSIAAGVDIVTFSGDKLLGGPQAGIIAGRGELIERLRCHPLYRALRVGKLIYAGLEATLLAYRRGAVNEVPVIAMLTLDRETIGARTEALIERFREKYTGRLQIEQQSGDSVVGGGAAPGVHLNTVLITLSHSAMTAEDIELALRNASPPVIARIENDMVLLDLRTVFPEEESVLIDQLLSIA